MAKMLLLALAAICIGIVHGQTCTDVTNCDSCSNPGPLCEDCPTGYVLSQDRTKCLACGTGCEECTSDASDVVTCTDCMMTYYLDQGSCSFCGAGCLECHLESAAIVCDTCTTIGYTQDMTTTSQACVACDSNCKTCSMNTDGTTTCSECYSYNGLNARGYYLRASDSTCRSCPSNCEVCTDDGTGSGICTSCYDSYEILVDENDSTNDGTKCVRCPSTCSTCTGVEFNTGIATCTACEPNEGLYLSSGECIECDANCDTCDDDGLCTECNVDYRVDAGTCTACPPFCQSCTLDESTGIESCSTCDSTYGPKESTSITCDSCGISNCDICTRDSTTGAYSCSDCKTGYGLNGDGNCGSCGTGCNECTWSTDYFRCTSCATGYTSNVYPAAADSNSGDPSACSECPSECATCEHNAGDGTVECNTCTTPASFYVSDSDKQCTANLANCITMDGSNDECTACEDGYSVDSGACDACTGDFCTTCDSGRAVCDGCVVGYGLVDTDFNNNTSEGVCESCGISKCEKCITWGGYSGASKLCFQCQTGYIPYDSSAGSRKATFGGACKSCPSGCNTCTVDYSTSNDATQCTSSGCKTWDGSRAYAYDGDGGCKQCPTKCQSCTYDSSTDSTICSSGQCYSIASNPLTLNEDLGECESCPDNCGTCEWDSSTSSIICTDGGCDTGYGNLADGTCGECPDNCDTCSVSDATDADDTLFCDDCSTGYGSNSDVCAKCPSNCAECSDSSGTMICSMCKDGYAMDTSGSCTKCPTNCATCTATGTLTCTECNSGYALAGDRLSCVICSTAAFENCAMCGSINATTGLAECDSCNFGYTLIDEEEDIGCVSTSVTTCLAGTVVDAGPECSTCSSGFTITDDYECAIMCYKCGDIGLGEFVDQSMCQIPAAGQNTTEGFAELEECTEGACYAALMNGQVQSGCIPSSFNGGVCGTTFMSAPVCSEAASTNLCVQCCDTDSCNDFVATMMESSAVTMATSAILIAVCTILSLRF